jgi:ABC-type uncharacterized transport system involved in gliding motility auxiliary subunit
MATGEQRRRAAAEAGILVVLIAAIVVAVNVLGALMYARKDVTKNEKYTLSVGSGRLLGTLKNPIQVDAYVRTGLPQLDAFVADLTDLLKEYESAGKGKFKFTLIEPTTDALRDQAKEAGLTEQPFVDPSQTGEDQASISKGYMGLVFKYGSEKTVIPGLDPMRGEGIEFWITNKIREIRDKADDIKHRVGVISEKDELKLSDQNLVPKQGRGGSPSMQSIMEQAFPFYKVEEVKLSEGEPIDKGFVGLIVTQPRKDYTDKELRRIDEFLMQGNKALVVYASAVTLKPQDASMNAEISTHNLDKLLSGYGIQMNKDAILDYDHMIRVPVPTQGGIAVVRHPGIAHVANEPGDSEEERPLDASFPAFFRMDEVIFPFPSSLKLMPEKQPKDVKVFAVAKTTKESTSEKSETVDMKLREPWRPKGPREQRVIAAVAQGKLKSAFAGSPDDSIKPAERAPADSRVLVVSSSLFLSNPFAYAGNGPDLGGQFQMFGNVGGDETLQAIAQPYAQKFLTNTILSFKNTLDWMAGDSDLIAASAKLMTDPSLTYASVDKPKYKDGEDEAESKRKDEDYKKARKNLQKKVWLSLTLGVPIVFGAFGIFRWRRRDAQRSTFKI